MGCADPGRLRQRLQGRRLACGADLSAGRLDQGAMIFVKGGLFRPASAAGPKARAARIRQCIVKADVFRPGLARRTGGPTIDPGGHDGIPEDALGAWISRMNLSDPTSPRRKYIGNRDLRRGHGVFQKVHFREDAAGPTTHYD